MADDTIEPGPAGTNQRQAKPVAWVPPDPPIATRTAEWSPPDRPVTEAAPKDQGVIGRLWDDLSHFAGGVAAGVEGEGLPKGRGSEFPTGRAGFAGQAIGAGTRGIAEGLWEAIKTPGQVLSGEKQPTVENALPVAMLAAGAGMRTPIVHEVPPGGFERPMPPRPTRGMQQVIADTGGGGPNPLSPRQTAQPEPQLRVNPRLLVNRPPNVATPTGPTLPQPFPMPQARTPDVVNPLNRPIQGQMPTMRPNPLGPGQPPPAGRPPLGSLSGEIVPQPQPAASRLIRPTDAIDPANRRFAAELAPTSPMADAIAANDGGAIDRQLAAAYRGTIRPGRPPGGVVGLREQDRRITNVIDELIKARPTLRVPGPVEGSEIPLPRVPSAEQFAAGLDQLKRQIFHGFDDIQRRAGDAGVRVDLAPVIAKADEIMSGVTGDVSPAAASEAARLRSVFEGRSTYTPAQAQEVIEQINQQSKAFHARGGEGADTTTIGVRNQLVRVLRDQLDHAVSTGGGPSYQALKLRYGAVRQVEQEVATAIAKWANKTRKLPFELADLFSAEQLFHGVIDPSSLPRRFGRAAAMQAGKLVLQHLKDPNRAIGRMIARREAQTLRTPYQLNRMGPSAQFDPLGGSFRTGAMAAGGASEQRPPRGASLYMVAPPPGTH